METSGNSQGNDGDKFAIPICFGAYEEGVFCPTDRFGVFEFKETCKDGTLVASISIIDKLQLPERLDRTTTVRSSYTPTSLGIAFATRKIFKAYKEATKLRVDVLECNDGNRPCLVSIMKQIGFEEVETDKVSAYTITREVIAKWFKTAPSHEVCA